VRRAAAVVIAMLGFAIAGCSDDSVSSSSAAPTSVSTVATTVAADTTVAATTTSTVVDTAAPTTEAPTTTEALPVNNWQAVTAPTDCMCANGSSYTYWIHQGDPTKVVFYLQGGGACFDPGTCAFDSGTYKVTAPATEDPSGISTGIFDFTDPRNPIGDYSVVYAPYCTGDLHLGTATHVYGPQLTVQHKGFVNASTALNDLAAHFPDAKQVLVTGESAGSAPTPLYGGMAHDLLPNAEIEVLADSSGAYPNVPAVTSLIESLWGTAGAEPAWPEVEAGADWSLNGLYIQANKHAPDILFARHDYAFDAVQTIFAKLAGLPSDNLVSLIDGNTAIIEQGGVDLHSYVAPGTTHTVLSRPDFYTETVEGVPFVDWVTDLVKRQPGPDVHCTTCQ
jgi:hypothetical protein